MAKNTRHIGYLYINGLGYGHERSQEKLMKWWWRRKGIALEHLQTNWRDGQSFDSKLGAAIQKAEDMLQEYDGITIIGTSAGGSLALNTYCELKDKNICLVSSHGRMKAGDYEKSDRRSMYRRARLGTDHPLSAFADSVANAEHNIIHNLTQQDKQRILTLDQLTDLIVPLETMVIDGTETHRSFTLGHSGGLIAHLIGDRDLIIRFTERVLSLK